MRLAARKKTCLVVRVAVLAVFVGVIGFGSAVPLRCFAQAAPANPGPQRGTVKSVDGDVLTVATDGGATVKITVPSGTKVQQLAPGSTDLKTATPSQLSDVAPGDRVLAAVRAGDSPDSYTARVVVLMKSTAIAQKNAEDQADWRRNGIGGIVSSVDPNGTILVAVGSKKVSVTTGPKTEFRRFAGDSVAYKDAKPGSLAQIRPGDQIQARGTKSEDGSSVQATEVVSGSFKNLSGLIATVNPAADKITLKDLATKKMYTVAVTPNSNLRKMPPQMAAMMAARSNGGGGRRGGAADSGAQGARAAGGGELSQMISRLPTDSLSEMKPGEAVMIVASEPATGSTDVTAVTLLTGVEPILTANPNGGVDLSGWSMSGGPTE